MFTGIVEALGNIVSFGGGGASSSRRLEVTTTLPVDRLPLGASIAVDGVCLTVVQRSAGRFSADVSPETLACTNLVGRVVGDRVHLERPLSVGDPLGGHLVAGHVDGVGRVLASRERGGARDVELAAPPEVARYLVPKGSITVDGVSLTVNTVDAVNHRFGVTLVPHTLAVTLLGERPVGTPVNLEADLIAKHVDRLVALYVGAAGARP